jgi:hypothetical protein
LITEKAFGSPGFKNLHLKNKKTFEDEEILIQNLKADLLNYLSNKKLELSEKNADPEKVFNVLTLEVINVLHNLLLFDMIQVKNSKKNPGGNLRATKASAMKNFGLNFFLKTEKEKKDIDILVENLAVFLEYDKSYFSALNEMEIQRSIIKIIITYLLFLILIFVFYFCF